MAASLLLTVGAVADPSLTSVFRPFLDASKKAQRSVEGMMSGAASSMSAPIEAASKKAQGAYRQNAAVGIQAAERVAAAEKKAADTKVREHERALAYVARIKERHFAEDQRRQERADAAMRASRERVGSAAMRNFGQYMGRGVGIAKDLGAGLGLDFSIAGNMGRARDLFSQAGDATRSAFTAQGRTATQADINATVAAIRKGGDEAKLAYADIAAGMTDFVAKSADLNTANVTLGQMGRLARATGTNVRDLLSAAGDVNRLLDDSPDRQERLMAIMRLTAKQTAMGNVEMPALAKYMGRMESTAFMYEGGLDKNMGILGALAQVGMKGGLSSAAEATRGAAAFARDITKGAALKRFEDAKIDVFANKERTALRGPEAIILDFLAKTKGDFKQLANLFQNQSSRAVVLGFQSIYKQAGGGDKGLDAVRAEFKRFTTTMTAQEVDAQAQTALDSPEARAQALQNKIETIAASLVERVLPSFERLAPNAEKAAEALAGIISFGAANPGLMIAGAITASIAKAAIGEAVSKSLATAIGSIGGKGLALGALTLLATTAYLIAQEYEENVDKSREDAKKSVEETIPELLARADKQLKDKGSIDKETIDEIARRRADIEGLRGAGDTTAANEKLSYVDMAIAKLAGDKGDAENYAAGEGTGEYAKGNKDKIDALAAKMDQMIKAFVDSKPKGPLDVNIVGGMPAPAGPGVDPGGRTDGVK